MTAGDDFAGFPPGEAEALRRAGIGSVDALWEKINAGGAEGAGAALEQVSAASKISAGRLVARLAAIETRPRGARWGLAELAALAIPAAALVGLLARFWWWAGRAAWHMLEMWGW